MPIQTKKLLTSLSNAKTRTFVLLFAILLFIGIVVAFLNKGGDTNSVLSQQGTETPAVPTQIKATPGNVVSPQYKEYQTAENQRKAETALKNQTSAIPTIVGATKSINADASTLGLNATPQNTLDQSNPRVQFGNAPGSELLGAKSAIDREREKQEAAIKQERDRVEKIRTDKEAALQKQQAAERARQVAEQEQKAYLESVRRIADQMKQYAGKSYEEWSKFPNQQYVQGQLASKTYKPSTPYAVSKSGSVLPRPSDISATTGQTGPKPVNPKKIIKAGTILFGVLDTSVNSDEPGPVLATVVSGKYHGSKLLGSLKHDRHDETVSITFNQMNVPKKPHSVGVSVVAIDPETARTALASDVNHHYLLRYGTLFASSFVAGYGQAIQQQGSTTTVSPLTGATTTTYPPLDNRQIFLSALGQVGTQWANATREYFNTPYTVTVNQGTGIGLLFMTDADLNEEGN